MMMTVTDPRGSIGSAITNLFTLMLGVVGGGREPEREPDVDDVVIVEDGSEVDVGSDI